MAEKIYDRNGAEQTVRSARPYKMATDTDGQPCYRELTDAEIDRRAKDARNATRPRDQASQEPSLDERVRVLEVAARFRDSPTSPLKYVVYVPVVDPE